MIRQRADIQVIKDPAPSLARAAGEARRLARYKHGINTKTEKIKMIPDPYSAPPDDSAWSAPCAICWTSMSSCRPTVYARCRRLTGTNRTS